MTDYLIRINRVPSDIPRDVLIEHLAVAVQKIQKGRKALKKIGIQVIDVTNDKPRKGRNHPFEGPEVNDDPPESYRFTAAGAEIHRTNGPYANGGFLAGDASTSMVAGDAGYVISAQQARALGVEGLETLSRLNRESSGTTIFSGKADDQDYDTTIRALVPEEPVVIEFDVEDILPDLYHAIAEDFPHLAELFEAKRAEHEQRQVRRNTEITDPPAEGDWELPGGDNVGEDV